MGVRFEEEEGEQLKFSSTTSSLPLLSLNHVSFLCKSLEESVRFYQNVLGFVLIRRPSSLKFRELDMLFNHGIGIHLLESSDLPKKKAVLNTKDNHISFQSSDMMLVIEKLEEMGIEYVTAQVEEDGIKVDQFFFHDPDGYMIEICNCQNLPVLPISSTPCPLKNLTKLDNTIIDIDNRLASSDNFYGSSRGPCSSEVEDQLIEYLVTDKVSITF